MTAQTQVTTLILEPQSFVRLLAQAPSIGFRFLRRANQWSRVVGDQRGPASITSGEDR